MKTNEKKTTAATVAAAKSASSPLPPVGGADALPSVGAPTPPANGNPVAVDARKGLRALAAEVDVAENAAKELRSSTLFAQILGPKLGTAQQIADAIDFAAQWYAQAQSGATWASYTQKQSNLSWSYVQAMLNRVRVAYQAAAAADPAIEKELVNFTKLLGARQAVAAKAAATKRKIKSGEIVVNKAAKPRKGTKVSTQATPTQAPVSAPAETAPAPAAAPGAPAVTPVTPSANGVNGAGTH
jgi:hypothetical protein